MARTYKVVGPATINGHKPGETFDGAGLNTAALVAGGMLEVVNSTEKTTCPSCVERNVRGKSKEYTAKQLQDHYAKDHPGLQPPAGEEE